MNEARTAMKILAELAAPELAMSSGAIKQGAQTIYFSLVFRKTF
jgi:hypothetical protein